jgi:hypothetical protein
MGLKSSMLPHQNAKDVKIDKKHEKACKNVLTGEILIVICSNTPETNIFKNPTQIRNFKMYLRNTQRLFNLSTA